MRKITPLDYKLLSELMKNAKSSDRQIAKKLGVSQPTITRRRALLEKKLSLNYIAIPDWTELGFEILAVTFAKWKLKEFPDKKLQQINTLLEKHPSIIFFSTGSGIGSDRICISLHETYRDYYRLVQDVRRDLGKYMENIQSFIISFGGDNILRPITLKHLAKYLKNLEERPSKVGVLIREIKN